jgi:hypothetical protein
LRGRLCDSETGVEIRVAVVRAGPPKRPPGSREGLEEVASLAGASSGRLVDEVRDAESPAR